MADRSPRARALVDLVEARIGARFAVKAARAGGLFAAAGAFGMLALDRGGGDGVPIAIARGAAAIAGYGGAATALALAATPARADDAPAVVALATSRRFSRAALAIAETRALVRLHARAVVAPIVALALVGAAMSGRAWHLALRTATGAVLFGVATAVLSATVVAACRKLGGPAGRRWLFAIVGLPWVVGALVHDARGVELASLPSFLAWLWTALTHGGLA